MYSFSAAAREIGTTRGMVAAAVQILGIEPKPITTNGKAKGLSKSDLTRIRRLLRLPAPAVAQRGRQLAG